MTRRTAIVIAAIAVVAVAVSGALLSNYVIPSRVNVTTLPGITVYLVNPDGTRGAIITTVDFGVSRQ